MKDKQTEQRKVELLAPAKDKACAFAAINAGADAVYIGASQFGARKKAGNTLDDLAEIIDYAHKFNVKIYITVNTILYDNELKSVEKLIHDLYNIQADAIIIQDMGILKMNLPPLPIHASTQCNNNEIEKIKFLESCNIERVVLPREFSIKEIAQVRRAINAEIEVFIHGALCVCYSGQCYLSASIGERSANRGECAQPCRKKYSLINENGEKIADSKYLLSMKDFSLANNLKELIEAGVDSLKIEGRLKDEEYVKNVVSYYRKLLDNIDTNLRPSNGILINNFEPDPNKTFNRGYTEFNINGECDSLIDMRTPKFLGERIGKVKALKGKKIKLDTKKHLATSDGIVFFDKNGELRGTTITKIENNELSLLDPTGIVNGITIFRNYDSSFIKKLKNTKFERKIPLNISVTVDENNINVMLNKEFAKSYPNHYEKAKNKEKARENLIAQFKKSAEFLVDTIEIDKDFELFIPISNLNEIRRDFLESYRQYKKNNYQRKLRTVEYTPIKYPKKELDYTYNVSNKMAKEFYESCGAKVIQPAFEKGTKGKCLMQSKHCVRRELGICLKYTPFQKLFLIDQHNKKYALNFDCKNCIMKIEEFEGK